MKPRLSCCEPRRTPFPSGWAWTHAPFCPSSFRGQKVQMHTTHPVTANVDDQREPSSMTPLRVWFTHPNGCECDSCQYIEHHLDRDDDRTLEPVAGKGRTAWTGM